MTRRITPQTTLDNLKKEAKQWLRELRANHADARKRFDAATASHDLNPGLRDVQLALAREFGFEGWTALKQTLEARPAPPGAASYDRLALDMVAAYGTGDDAALQRINQHYQRSATIDDLRAQVWGLMYKVRQARGAAESFQVPEAQETIARTAGFGNWTALIDAVSAGEGSPVPPFAIDAEENSIAPQRDLVRNEWDQVLSVIKEQRIPAIDANGRITDDVLRRLAELDHITSLSLAGSRQLSAEGLKQLTRMPQLDSLDLSGLAPDALTDGSLDVLRHLPNLRNFKMVWQASVSDAGIANLKSCDRLETVGLMGSPAGDGTLEALRGKQNLRRLETGRLVTDAGLAFLQDYPQFKTDQGRSDAKDGEEATRLMIDGPFSDRGLAPLAGLDGVYNLDFFWHVTNVTADGFAVLPQMRNVEFLGCDGELSNDQTMHHIGSMLRLRRLRAQGTVATDGGYLALSRSTTLEDFWGRENPGLTGRGFIALSKMPSLRSLAVSCKSVDNQALSTLPNFPALRELTPIDVTDAGFRHIGGCARLDRLVCMYCRETTDVATAHIAQLDLTSYYAGLTKITDRSLEILGRMESLESIELFETKSVTNAGLAALTGLPRLRKLVLTGLPLITFAGTQVFPKMVKVRYDV